MPARLAFQRLQEAGKYPGTGIGLTTLQRIIRTTWCHSGRGRCAPTSAGELPVVVLASWKEDQGLVNGYKFGCNSYESKRVDLDEFIEARARSVSTGCC
jgi:hypothetical protein